MDSSKKSLGSLILAMSIFGTIGLFVRLISLPSSVIALVRGAVATVFLLIFVRCRHLALDKSAIRRNLLLLLLSGIMISFNWIFLFESYRYTTVATATLCYYMAPVMVTLASPLVLNEHLGLKRGLCVLVAVIGMVFVSGVPQSGLPKQNEALGIALALCSAVLYACALLANKKMTPIPAYDRTILQMGTAALVMIPYILLTEDVRSLAFSPRSVVLLLVVGVLHTGISYALYFGSIGVLPVQTVALLSYIDPIVAVLLSALLLKEPLGWSGALGAVLVLGSTLISELPDQKPSFK